MYIKFWWITFQIEIAMQQMGKNIQFQMRHYFYGAYFEFLQNVYNDFLQ